MLFPTMMASVHWGSALNGSTGVEGACFISPVSLRPIRSYR